MEKIFKFGKIDFNGCGRKINPVEVTINLYQRDDEKLVFAACGDIWNSKHTDILYGGQCLDEINNMSIGANSTFKEIYRLWKLYHMNDMHAGTERQENALQEHFEVKPDYTTACEYLASIDLLEDKEHMYNGKPYRYGTAWQYREIPFEDLLKIKELLA